MQRSNKARRSVRVVVKPRHFGLERLSAGRLGYGPPHRRAGLPGGGPTEGPKEGQGCGAVNHRLAEKHYIVWCGQRARVGCERACVRVPAVSPPP